MNDKISPLHRLASLDFLRGLTMVLLTLESARLYSNLEPLANGTFMAPVVNQFFHHPWHGLRLWDLIQPVFMFVAGVSLAFSVSKMHRTMNWNQRFIKILKSRKVKLLFSSIIIQVD